jgi:hypothetical protein
MPARSIDLDTAITVTIIRNTVQIGGGGLPWPIQSVVNDIVELLVQRGVISIPPLYSSMTHSNLLDISALVDDLGSLKRAQAYHRVGGKSILVAFGFGKA